MCVCCIFTSSKIIRSILRRHTLTKMVMLQLSPSYPCVVNKLHTCSPCAADLTALLYSKWPSFFEGVLRKKPTFHSYFKKKWNYKWEQLDICVELKKVKLLWWRLHLTTGFWDTYRSPDLHGLLCKMVLLQLSPSYPCVVNKLHTCSPCAADLTALLYSKWPCHFSKVFLGRNGRFIVILRKKWNYKWEQLDIRVELKKVKLLWWRLHLTTRFWDTYRPPDLHGIKFILKEVS
jgi:hypothetical protein